MGEGIFKHIFGNFVNTFGNQIKILTSKNILNANTAQIYQKFHKIIPF